MRVIDIQKKEDCFDGSMIFEYWFDDGFSRQLMYTLAEGGKLQFFPDFTRPFFKIVTAGGVHIKGIIGDLSIEALFPLTGKWERKDEFEKRLAGIMPS